VFQVEEISYATQWNDYLSITNEIRLFENGILCIIYIYIFLLVKYITNNHIIYSYM